METTPATEPITVEDSAGEYATVEDWASMGLQKAVNMAIRMRMQHAASKNSHSSVIKVPTKTLQDVLVYKKIQLPTKKLLIFSNAVAEPMMRWFRSGDDIYMWDAFAIGSYANGCKSSGIWKYSETDTGYVTHCTRCQKVC